MATTYCSRFAEVQVPRCILELFFVAPKKDQNVQIWKILEHRTPTLRIYYYSAYCVVVKDP